MKIDFEKICKSFGHKAVLENINFSLRSGNIYGLLGKNGSGKSTIIHLIVQFISADQGKIYYDGSVYQNLPKKIKHRVGLLAESGLLIEELNLQNYLELVGRYYHLDKRYIRERTEALTAIFFGEEAPQKEQIASFSTGMKKKAGLCAALLHEPELLILDEPFAGMDLFSVRRTVDYLKSYQREDRTILLTSHNLQYLERMASHLIILGDKNILYQGTLSDMVEEKQQALEERFVTLFENDQAQL